MAFLVTDATGVWKITRGQEDGRRLLTGETFPCFPCEAAGIGAVCLEKSRECLCFRSDDGVVVSSMPSVPGLCGLMLSPCARYLYQLSSEADFIHTRVVATGELVYAAPAGVFPRMMQQIHGGRQMICAGGAISECYVFELPTLMPMRVISTRHPCFAAAQWHDGLVLVCASEGEDIHTLIYTLCGRAIRPRKLAELPGIPGSLYICPDGVTALLGTQHGLMMFALRTGEVIWNRPELALATHLSCRRGQALVSDTPDGNVHLISLLHPWEEKILFRGSSAQACFL